LRLHLFPAWPRRSGPGPAGRPCAQPWVALSDHSETGRSHARNGKRLRSRLEELRQRHLGFTLPCLDVGSCCHARRVAPEADIPC
jgi:hypothetical protein